MTRKEGDLVELALAVAGAALGVCGEQLERMGVEPALREGTLFLAFSILVIKHAERWTPEELSEFERVARAAAPLVTLLMMPRA